MFCIILLYCFTLRRERFFDLLGNNPLVLNRLVYTLALILQAAVNTTVRALHYTRVIR